MKNPTALFLILSVCFSACQKVDTAVSLTTANERFRQSIEWNSRYPYRSISVSSDNYAILCMGDSHVGGTKNLDIFFEKAKSVNAAAIVMVGDLTSGSENDYSSFEQHLPVQTVLPSFCLLGNHDLYYDGWNRFNSRFGSTTYLFSINNPSASDLFICLDTASGTLGNEQIDWLRNILESDRPKYRRCIVFTHNNLFLERHTDSSAMSIDELNVLIELFTVNKVDMEISGHDHKRAFRSFGPTTYIIMDALRDGLTNAGYFEINIKKGIVGYQFMNL